MSHDLNALVYISKLVTISTKKPFRKTKGLDVLERVEASGTSCLLALVQSFLQPFSRLLASYE